MYLLPCASALQLHPKSRQISRVQTRWVLPSSAFLPLPVTVSRSQKSKNVTKQCAFSREGNISLWVVTGSRPSFPSHPSFFPRVTGSAISPTPPRPTHRLRSARESPAGDPLSTPNARSAGGRHPDATDDSECGPADLRRHTILQSHASQSSAPATVLCQGMQGYKNECL